MIYKINIKLTTAFLGSRKPDESNVRNIARINGRNPKLFTKRLRDLCYKYATEELGIWDYDYTTIKVDCMLHVDETAPVTTHVRKFYNKELSTMQQENFEAYPVGTEMSFSLYVPSSSKITKSTILQLFQYIGQYDGISQFGINWGYGKFEITSVDEDKNATPSEIDEIIDASSATNAHEEK